MFPDVSDGAWAAFLVGLIVSPHCVGMCGPLYCSFLPSIHKDQMSGSREGMQVMYHLGRILSYTAIGALAGALSLPFASLFEISWIQYMPWVLIAFLLLFAIGADRWLQKRFPKAIRLPFKPNLTRIKAPAEASALTLGIMTPLLPCAPLYMVLWVALISASPLFGAQIMLGFSLGTIPLLWISQSQFLRHRHRWKPQTIQSVQRGLAVVAALLLAARLIWIGAPLEGAACIAS